MLCCRHPSTGEKCTGNTMRQRRRGGVFCSETFSGRDGCSPTGYGFSSWLQRENESSGLGTHSLGHSAHRSQKATMDNPRDATSRGGNAHCHTHTHTRIHTHTHQRWQSHTRTRTHVHTYTHTHAHTHTYTHTYTHTRVHTHIDIHASTRTYIHAPEHQENYSRT